MQPRSTIRIAAILLGLLALCAAVLFALAQRRTISRLSASNQQLQAEAAELDRFRAEAKSAESLRGLESEVKQLREDNHDLLRLRNEVRQLREHAKELEVLRTANASLLQAVQNTPLSAGQHAMVVDARKEGALLGVIALPAEDPRGGPANSVPYSGVVVMGIDSNSPAIRADLKIGDVIVRVDGRPVDSLGQLQAEMLTRKPGDIVTLDVMRSNSLLRVPVETRAWPK